VYGEHPYGIDAGRRLELAIDFINRRHGDAALCLFLGDLTVKGQEAEYARLGEIIRRLRVPARFAVGNHDCRDRFLNEFTDHPRDEKGFIQFSHSLEHLTCVVADTFEPGQASGSICDTRLASLAAILERLRGQLIMLFLHHPPLPVGIPALDRICLEAHAEAGLSRALTSSGVYLRHTFFGHLHRTIFSSWAGAPCAAIPSTAHLWPRSFESVVEAQLYNGPPQLGIVKMRPNNIVVQIQDILTASGDWPNRTVRELIRTMTDPK
jgi:hypothetical protein